MAVTCGNCGEELLGAVNRCWRCGQHVLSAPGSGEAPPVRQAPLNVELQPHSAAIVAEEVVASTTDNGAASPATPPVASTATAIEVPAAVVLNEVPPRPADYSHRGAVDVAAVAAVVLGVLALLLGVFFSAATVLGFLGLAAGLWGFKSRWRQIAVVGLLLSLMGIAGGSARLAYDAYSWISGQSLLGPAAPTNIESTLPDSLE